jgi:hypothetical protein
LHGIFRYLDILRPEYTICLRQKQAFYLILEDATLPFSGHGPKRLRTIVIFTQEGHDKADEDFGISTKRDNGKELKRGKLCPGLRV